MYNRVLSGNSSRHLRGWGNSCYFMLNTKLVLLLLIKKTSYDILINSKVI